MMKDCVFLHIEESMIMSHQGQAATSSVSPVDFMAPSHQDPIAILGSLTGSQGCLLPTSDLKPVSKSSQDESTALSIPSASCPRLTPRPSRS